jgi:hypothetical protein
MIDWLISLVPWWAWLLAAAVAIGAAWRLLGWQGALVAGGALLAVLGYGKGRAEGVADERGRTRDRNLDAMKDRKEIDDEVADLGSNDLDERYRRWLSDDDLR